MTFDPINWLREKIAHYFASRALLILRASMDTYRDFPECEGSLAWEAARLGEAWAEFYIEIAKAIIGENNHDIQPE